MQDLRRSVATPAYCTCHGGNRHDTDGPNRRISPPKAGKSSSSSPISQSNVPGELQVHMHLQLMYQLQLLLQLAACLTN
jgi:hypothetical protein